MGLIQTRLQIEYISYISMCEAIQYIQFIDGNISAQETAIYLLSIINKQTKNVNKNFKGLNIYLDSYIQEVGKLYTKSYQDEISEYDFYDYLNFVSIRNSYGNGINPITGYLEHTHSNLYIEIEQLKKFLMEDCQLRELPNIGAFIKGMRSGELIIFENGEIINSMDIDNSYSKQVENPIDNQLIKVMAENDELRKKISDLENKPQPNQEDLKLFSVIKQHMDVASEFKYFIEYLQTCYEKDYFKVGSTDILQKRIAAEINVMLGLQPTSRRGDEAAKILKVK